MCAIFKLLLQCDLMYFCTCSSNIITPCRTWLFSGLYCFSLAWKTPSLEGYPRRLQRQKPISFCSIGPLSLGAVVSWFFIISFPICQDLGWVLSGFRINLPPLEFGSFGFTWIKLLAIIIFVWSVIISLETIFQLLNLYFKRENKRMREACVIQQARLFSPC